jgi:hypothetical protein
VSPASHILGQEVCLGGSSWRRLVAAEAVVPWLTVLAGGDGGVGRSDDDDDDDEMGVTMTKDANANANGGELR